VACGGSEDGRGTGDLPPATSLTAADGGADGDGSDTGGDGDGDGVDGGDETGVGQNCGDDSDNGAGGTEEDYDFSYIWIANSPEGTVSKIDTITGVEQGRYQTGPASEFGPDPSRTSVNLHGDVAVLNRRGSVTKIATRLEECVDNDGDGQITTSTGPADVKAWGDDECVLWHQDLPFTANLANGNNPNTFGPRPCAWEHNVNSETCQAPAPRLWVGWYEGPTTHRAVFRRLAGDTGITEDEVFVDGVGDDNWGPYGGAVDPDNNFWAVGGGPFLVKIDAVTLDTDIYPTPGKFYGIAVDADGRPWITGGGDNTVSVFDPASGTFTSTMGADVAGEPDARLRGLAIDGAGYGWAAGNAPCRLVKFDAANPVPAMLDTNIQLPNCQTLVGVAVDAAGFIWAVDRAGNQAFKVDPATQQVQLTVAGLVSPYTYSDMTGFGLSLVSVPEG
jgi:DNA-binding beta-propeller fold protein YncE